MIVLAELKSIRDNPGTAGRREKRNIFVWVFL
jgi:hypothetical protein